MFRPWQNNSLVPVTRPTLAQNALNRRLNTFFRAPARNENHGDSWKWNCKKLVAIFYKRRDVMQARRSWIPSWTPETHNSNLSERPKCPISFTKTCLMFFRQSLILRFTNHVTINQVIGMSHGKTGANWEWPLSWHHSSDITLIMTSSFCLHKDGGFTKVLAKIYTTFTIKLHIFWFDFSKAINLY